MKKFNINIRRELKIVAAFILVAGLIAFSERKQNDVVVHDMSVRLENISENHFLKEADVMRLMNLNLENLKGANIHKVDLRDLESKIKKNRFVSDADIYSDLNGNLVVRVDLQRPIARLVRTDGPDGYIAEDGTIMPVSEEFTSRVVLLSGSYVKKVTTMQNLNESQEGSELMEMLLAIKKDDFWKAQISQLDIDAHGRISILPQVGDEVIEFGKPKDLESKFSKLMIYYKEILPRMGWNKYKRVNLEYKGQIVAE
jgi:cell division protein FtsQ